MRISLARQNENDKHSQEEEFFSESPHDLDREVLRLHIQYLEGRKMEKVKALIFLNSLTAVCMATCIFTAQVKIQWFGFTFPASNLFFAFLTFPITDIIADVYGKKEANRTVLVGFFSQLLSMAIIETCLLFGGDAQKLEPFHSGGLRLLIGGSLAYLVAQYWDVWVFHYIKEKWTGERHLWLRNNISTFTSQMINSTIWIGFVFGFESLPELLKGSIVIKLIIAVIDTPFVYLGKRILLKWYSGNQNKTVISDC